MRSRLIVKNFGPIDEVDLDLRNVNVFIGPQASGKSALAKLFTIFKAPRRFLKNGASTNLKNFHDVLEEYNILSFLKPNTEISLQSEVNIIAYKEGTFDYKPLLKNLIAEIAVAIEEFKSVKINDFLIKKKLQNLQESLKLSSPRWHEIDLNSTDEYKYEQFSEAINSLNKIEETLSTQFAIYIPSERSFINIVKNAIANLLINNVPIPKHILLFGAEIEKSSLSEIDLGFLQQQLVYKNVNGEGRIFTSSENSIKLIEAASGIQSAVPLLISVLSNKESSDLRSFVIEEPELNLFPDAQYELIKMLEGSRTESYTLDTGSVHTYTTHSPYILSSFNTLLFASKIWNKYGVNSKYNNPEKIEELKQIIPTNSNIQPDVFSAYQLGNNTAVSIFDRERGMIRDNGIDLASDTMSDDFDNLLTLI